jgi:cation:H+ antiporter
MPHIGYFALGLILLLLGSDSMAKGVSGLAQRFGLPPFLAGWCMLGFALSLPDLAVSAYALHAGMPELALGNVVGNSVASLGLILPLALFIAPLSPQPRGFALPVVLALVAAGMLLLLGRDGWLQRWEGAGLLAAFAAWWLFVGNRLRGEATAVQQTLAAFAETRTGLQQNLLRIAVAVVVLFLGGKFLLVSAPALGSALGLSPMLTGVLVLGIATALPDFYVAAMAARQGQGDIVFAQALGACLFNLLFVLGGLATWQALPMSAGTTAWQWPALMAFVLLLQALFATRATAGRREGGILLAAFALWLLLECSLLRH